MPDAIVGVDDLQTRLEGVLGGAEWGSPEMAEAINASLAAAVKETGMTTAAALMLLWHGASVAPPPALRVLNAVQCLSPGEFEAVVARAWTNANHGSAPPPRPGYVSFGGETVLQLFRRMKRKGGRSS